MKYRVVKGSDAGKLEDAVNNLCKQGWEPQGGITVGAVSDGAPVFLQPMILEEEWSVKVC